MKLHAQRGGSTVVAMLFGLSIIVLYYWSSADNVQKILSTPSPYSAEYAISVENGYRTEIPAVQQGLYHFDQQERYITARYSLALMTAGTFQIDVDANNTSFFAAARSLKGSLRGRYVQKGSVFEFSDLTGDKGLLPDPSKVLLKQVGESEIDVLIPYKREQSIYHFVRVGSKLINL
jgi:hypothetical protein